MSIFLLLSCTRVNADIRLSAAPVPAIKGVWVTNVASDALDSRAKITETVALCKKSGITDIYVVCWNRGRTLYQSKIMKSIFNLPIMERFGSRDPLQEMIEEGHKAGMRVHAWFEFGFASSYGENGGAILKKFPDWKAIDNKGNLVSKNGFEWMNAMHPEVQNFILSLVLEVVQNYDVDGIQGDDRLPAMPSLGGYDKYTLALYKKEHQGNLPPNDYKNADWLTWRADKLTFFLGKLYKEVKAIKPKMIVSMAPSIHPWAKEEYLQDWPTWLAKGYCDYVIPQVYRKTIESYTSTLESQLKYLPANQKSKFFSGVLLQVNGVNPSPEFLKAMIEANRKLGIQGESFFFYEGLKAFPDYFSKEYIKK
ncbi:glycoside hydrolase family 10 protein [Flavobacterium nackdongense]|uniref:glycoside hydrolase family 10 protein n=1 Tax=Flavobacterium nackdongense TaxID=2547394 RepID=UPI001D1313DE|nr:family 10 glycosylhydrolase [Flavobacterium nackdongense]